MTAAPEIRATPPAGRKAAAAGRPGPTRKVGRRKMPRRAFWSAAGRRAGVGLAVAVGFGVPMWWYASGGLMRTWNATGDAVWRQIEAASASAGLVVKDILVEGRERTKLDAIRAALAIGHGKPLLTADLAGAQQRIETLPWVRAAAVTRYLPDTIFVRIEEHDPMALWQDKKTLFLIAADGSVIQKYSGTAFSHLPLVVGADAPKHAAALLKMLATAPDIARTMTAAVRVGGRRWTLHLEGPVEVMLPEKDPAAAWARLAQAQRRHAILSRKVTAIDLRFGDKVILRPAANAAPGKTAPNAVPAGAGGPKYVNQST